MLRRDSRPWLSRQRPLSSKRPQLRMQPPLAVYGDGKQLHVKSNAPVWARQCSHLQRRGMNSPCLKCVSPEAAQKIANAKGANNDKVSRTSLSTRSAAGSHSNPGTCSSWKPGPGVKDDGHDRKQYGRANPDGRQSVSDSLAQNRHHVETTGRCWGRAYASSRQSVSDSLAQNRHHVQTTGRCWGRAYASSRQSVSDSLAQNRHHVQATDRRGRLSLAPRGRSFRSLLVDGWLS